MSNKKSLKFDQYL